MEEINLTDKTRVNGLRWDELKKEVFAIDSDYKSTSNYTDLSDSDKALVYALIDAQSRQGNMTELIAVPYQTG